MLRSLFGQPKRIDQGILLQTNSAIKNFCSLLREMHLQEKLDSKYYRLELRAIALIDALNELEQSVFCSRQYGNKVSKSLTIQMNSQELEQYDLHVYFYKNAFIRVFSILDKLGHFMNELFELKTEKIKEKFSYFTVTRNMYNLRIHPILEEKLFDIKETYKESMNKLRKKRNMEIHYINVEMLDDLKLMARSFAEGEKIEDLDDNLAVLDQGFEMVCLSLYSVFTYATEENIT